MKNNWIVKFAILTLTLSSAFSLSALAQTTDEGTGPSDQPDAPLEVGQAQPSDQPPYKPNDAQPTEAQPGGPSGEGPASTDQGVARISLIHNDVSTQRGDSGDWSAAVLNQPVMTGDKLSTGDTARAELQLDFANTLRLGPNSKANIANLTQKVIQIQIGEGLADYTVSKDSEAEPEIDTPNVSIHPSHHDGVFRVEVHPGGDTIVIVRQGEAQISTPQGSTEIRSGEMATVRGDSTSAQYKISSAPDRDDWDRWNSDRDHLIRDANSWRHTNRRYTGTQDLDAYGRWQNVPDYGDVWVPNEPNGWVPYRDGNWTYEPYYGWTWVGYEPWGWAPYHYGRWFPYGNSWAWWPGPVYGGYRPFWSPAYVSFWGWGGGFGFGFGFGGWGGFGWLPIGPCDFFHPWWGGYRGRFGVVGFAGGRFGNFNRFGGFSPLHGGNRFSNINNIHNNHVFRAMSTVNAGRFGAGQVRGMAATREQINGARMMAGNLPVVPSRASLSASGRAAAPSTVRNGGSERFFGSHNNVARPASFHQETASLRQSMQQSHVGAVPAGGRDSFTARSGNSMQRPSAGIPANHEMNNHEMNTTAGRNANQSAQNGNNEAAHGTASRQMDRGSSNASNNTANRLPAESPRGTASQPVDRGGFRPFTPPNGNTAGSNRSGESNSRGFSPSESPRGTSQSPSENRGGFRPFTPPSNSGMSRGESNVSSPRGGSSNYWNRTAPSTMSPRSSSSPYGGGSRPQLDMRQPIVRGPSYGGSGGYRGAPGYSAPRGGPSYSAPRGGPSYSAPRGGGGRAPSGGGGHSSGGGGGHASGGGGGHASGGGGHSSSHR
ncbi:MAG TPA: DUF6600 domain-containing protein [Candidatus Sulfotelmatobacter sp.]|nr:DUF6600 domain-containing protein [Candidatus Sulfotelmatobacter sp.]